MGGPAGGLRAHYESSTLDMIALKALARDVAQYPIRAATGLISNEALPEVQSTRTVYQEVQVPGLFRSRTETRQMTEVVNVPDETKQMFGWWFGMLRWSDTEKRREKPGAYVADKGRISFALLSTGDLATITETWREGVLIGGPAYQRWSNELSIQPLTADDVVKLDHDIRSYSGIKSHGIAYTNEQFGSHIRDGVRSKGDYVRSCLIKLATEAQRGRLAATYSAPTRSTTRLTGRVKWVDTGKGFGFIIPNAGGNDLFFHISQIDPPTTPLPPGTAVSYEIRDGKKGPGAVAVRASAD